MDSELHVRPDESRGTFDRADGRIIERQTDSWFRECHNGRVEIMCKTRGYRIRVLAPEQEAWEAVELFERWTGLEVSSDRRPPRRQRVPAGQLSMVELEADGNGD